MELYQLDYILHELREDQGWLFMAEIPQLPGCRAWGESAENHTLLLEARDGYFND